MTLDPADQAIIEEELALHERVRQAVRKAALEKMPNMDGIRERLVELRDEAIHASERDLPSLFQQLNIHHSLAARSFEKVLPDLRAPYFGRMVLEEEGKTRQILIGNLTFIDSTEGITIVDWRHAQIAKLFFNFKEGEDYEIDLPGRTAEGFLKLRRVLAFDVGELVGITTPGLVFMRQKGGEWRKGQDAGAAVFVDDEASRESRLKFGTGLTNMRRADVSALLDAQQYEILSRHDKEPLLILGGAGCGKTTVALHRMSQLHYRKPKFYTQNSMMVVVPEQGLVRLTERLLRNLDLRDVHVSTFDEWIKKQARRLLIGVPKRFCDVTPARVILAKRHPAMVSVVERYVRIRAERIAEDMRRSVAGTDSLAAEFTNSKEPLVLRLETFERRCRQTLTNQKQIEGFFRRQRQEIVDSDIVRSEIYTMSELQDVLKAGSDGVIDDSALKELEGHQRRQYADVQDTGGIKAVDGTDLDRDEYAGTLDVEDIPVLLYAQRLFAGRMQVRDKAMTKFSHLVVDEAQDLAPLELKLLGETLHERSSVTVAGDAAQQSDPFVVFRGWPTTLSHLGVREVEATQLTTNYRCPRPIAEFGHAVLGPLAPDEPPNIIREGRPVLQTALPEGGVAFARIAEALGELFNHEKLASVAIICADEESAREVYGGLSNNLQGVRLVLDGEFTFKPGIDVTDVAQVKGLEFDYVIIPDANARQYPDAPVARRALHVAVTRAVHQLWVISSKTPSPLLPANL